jgi:hypothetical protein
MKRVRFSVSLGLVCAMCAASCMANMTNLAVRVAEAEQAAGSETWTWSRVGYGPLEIASTALVPLAGILVGGLIGVLVPLKGMESHCVPLVPYTAVAGGAIGATTGAMLSPIIAVEGVFDLMTAGAFAKRPFSWFNVKVPMDMNMDTDIDGTLLGTDKGGNGNDAGAVIETTKE